VIFGPGGGDVENPKKGDSGGGPEDKHPRLKGQETYWKEENANGGKKKKGGDILGVGKRKVIKREKKGNTHANNDKLP